MRKKGTFFLLLGGVLLLAALALTGYNLYDEQRAGETANDALQALMAYIPSTAPAQETLPLPTVQAEDAPVETQFYPDYLIEPKIEMPTREIDGEQYIGILTIPSVGLELPILSQWSDANLKIAPARYTGSIYTNDMVIAGHNYDTHFGRIPELSIGAAATFTDMDGNVFFYELAEIVIIEADDVEGMCTGDWDLTLFTCTWGGADRITLRLTGTPAK